MNVQVNLVHSIDLHTEEQSCPTNDVFNVPKCKFEFDHFSRTNTSDNPKQEYYQKDHFETEEEFVHYSFYFFDHIGLYVDAFVY